MMRINSKDHVVLGLLLMGAFALTPQVTLAAEGKAAHGNQSKRHTTAAIQSRNLKGKASDTKGAKPRLEIGRKEKPRPGDYLPIQVDKTGLRDVPRILSRPTVALPRGARVLVLDTKCAWVRVQFGTHIGWVRTETLVPHYPLDLHKGRFSINLGDPNSWEATAEAPCSGSAS